MKLSEAIRLGAMLKPQGFGPMSAYSAPASCALGSAADAVGVRITKGSGFEEILVVFPWLRTFHAVCPQCGTHRVVLGIVWHLNDKHRWTREAIADWVATIEAQQEAAPVEQPVSVTA